MALVAAALPPLTVLATWASWDACAAAVCFPDVVVALAAAAAAAAACWASCWAMAWAREPFTWARVAWERADAACACWAA